MSALPVLPAAQVGIVPPAALVHAGAAGRHFLSDARDRRRCDHRFIDVAERLPVEGFGDTDDGKVEGFVPVHGQ